MENQPGEKIGNGGGTGRYALFIVTPVTADSLP